MSFDLGSVVATIKADTSNFVKGMDKAQKEVGHFGEASERLSKGISSFAKQAAVLTGVATTAVIVFGKQSVNAYNEAELALKQTEAVLESTGGVAGVTMDQVLGLASALQKTTMFSDETVQSGENLLLTFTNIGKDIFPQATETMLDMSQALGQDVKSSAIQLGKALQDPILGVTALRRVGVNFNESQAEMIKKLVESGQVLKAQKYILAELKTEFGDSATMAGTTFAGQIEILKNRFGDFQEVVGKLIATLGVFALSGDDEGLFDAINTLIPDDDTAERITNFIINLRNAFVKLGQWASENKDAIITVLKGIGIALALILTVGGVTIILGAITSTIGLLIIAITALYYAWSTNFLGIKDLTIMVFEQLSAFFWGYVYPFLQMIVIWFRANWDAIKLIIEGSLGVIKGIIQMALSIIMGIIKFWLAVAQGDFKGAWNAVVEMAKNFQTGLLNVFWGIVHQLDGVMSIIYGKLVEPFERALQKITDIAKQIKEKFDLTQKHSPSVIDIINRGVFLANKAFSKLEVPAITGISASSGQVSSGMAQSSSNYGNIVINLDGAIVGDIRGASEIAEKIGDSIIQKLQGNIRF